MSFEKYQHLERFGTSAVEGIDIGTCHVFPKIDGTNASVWLHGYEVRAGSRNRELTIDNDNAGFYQWAIQQESIREYLLKNPDDRLFGEWLVPHSLKTYRESAWRQFYIFDVVNSTEEGVAYQPFEFYKDRLAEFDLNVIHPLSIIQNPSREQLYRQLEKNTYLIEDGQGAGEGVVVKNYDFVNKYGKVVWAKIVTTEFREKNTVEMGATVMNGQKQVEESIAAKYVTEALCEKVKAKIENDGGFTSKSIPRYLNSVYYDVVNEDCWNFVKENKSPVIDFKKLQHHVFHRVKRLTPDVFGVSA